MAVDSTSFYNDPDRYELISQTLSGKGPVDFYRTFALQAGGPVLELACGTGRLAIPIAEAGLDITGLDASNAMLALAEAKTRGSGLPLSWIPADMRDFNVRRRFRCIIAASNSFSHLYSRADIESCLASVRRHLDADGRFVLDVFNPALGLFVRPPEQRVPVAVYRDSRSQGSVSVSKCVRYDAATQIAHETWFFRNETTGEDVVAPLNLRMFFPQELDALLQYNGFDIDSKFGDLDQSEFTATSRKQILLCRRSTHSTSA